MGRLPNRPPPGTRRLAQKFRDGLNVALGSNLVGAYLLGSVAFPGYRPGSADLDFFVVTRRLPGGPERKAIGQLHRSLAREFALGNDMDGLYITARMARSRRRPLGMAVFPSGRVRTAVPDREWALHRAHLNRGACIPLVGPPAGEVFTGVSWGEIAAELDRELVILRSAVRRYPAYCTLNLCRLWYSWAHEDAVVSKKAAGDRARRRLPAPWKRLIASALRKYDRRDTGADRRRLRSETTSFYAFMTRRIAEAKGP